MEEMTVCEIISLSEMEFHIARAHSFKACVRDIEKDEQHIIYVKKSIVDNKKFLYYTDKFCTEIIRPLNSEEEGEYKFKHPELFI
jgi:hypothetical protein